MRRAFHGTRYEFPSTAEGYKQRDELDAAIIQAQPERGTHTYEDNGVLYLSVWRPLYNEPYIAPAIARNYPSTTHGRSAERLVYERMLYEDTYVPEPVREIVKPELSAEQKETRGYLFKQYGLAHLLEPTPTPTQPPMTIHDELKAMNPKPKTEFNMQKKPAPTPWYGWLILLAIIGLIVWSQMPKKPPTPRELKKQEMKDLSDALRKCEGVSEKLQSACKEIELEKQR
jgi:hypothetical protein